MPYRCANCFQTFPAWSVACPGCKRVDWLYAVETAPADRANADSGPAPLEKLAAVHSPNTLFIKTGWDALDSVLGGGLARSAVYLLAGSPGAGKSTLALTIAAHASPHVWSTLYVSGEEPLARLAERARRLELGCAALDVCTITELGALTRAVRRTRPRLVIVDSINVITSDRLRSRAGSPSQMLNSGIAFVRLAQSRQCAIILIGHVTKLNQLSGPRSVEHYCDAMINFNSVGETNIRTLILTKNRFGPAHVPMQFIMSETGLAPALDTYPFDVGGIRRVS